MCPLLTGGLEKGFPCPKSAPSCFRKVPEVNIVQQLSLCTPLSSLVSSLSMSCLSALQPLPDHPCSSRCTLREGEASNSAHAPTAASRLRLTETQKVTKPDASVSLWYECGPSPMTLPPESPSPFCTEIKISLASKHLQAGTQGV